MIEQLTVKPALPAMEHGAPTDELITTVHELFVKQQAHRWVVAQTTATQRIHKLKRLKSTIMAYRAELYAAMHADFRKQPTEVELTEVQPTLREINYAIKHLHRWMRPKRVGRPQLLAGTRSAIRYEPRGVVLILAPWNYPFNLLFTPLVAAVAAGNCAIVRPSEKVPHTAKVLAAIVAEVFAPDEVALVAGDVAVAEELLTLPFDHIFFTGSVPVGRKVMAAAARHLTPVTLELGGKSPVVIDQTADMAEAAHRIVWGKFVNSGQTCVAPDYALVHESQASAFLHVAEQSIAALYGATPEARQASPDFPRLVDDAAYRRLSGLLAASIEAGARVVVGGEHDAADRYIAPTILADVNSLNPIMDDEIFGPILPVLTYRTLDDVVAFVNARPKPLALYIFSKDQSVRDDLIARTSAGGTVVNNVLLHLGNPELPFGGVGASGNGSYHGWFGFRTFSHERALLVQGPLRLDRLLYPPYTRRVQWLTRLIGRVLT